MLQWDVVLSTLIGIVLSTAVVVPILKHLIEKAFEKALDHEFAKLLENHKTENSLIVERFKLAAAACREMHTLVSKIEEDLSTLKSDGDVVFLSKLLSEFHPIYRRRYQTIRASFEAANDVFSSYSLACDRLLHPEMIRELAPLLRKQSVSDTKRMYRKLWTTVSESMTCLVRVCGDARFWKPSEGYGERADKWAAYDEEQLRAFLKHCVAPPSAKVPIFYLSLEEKGGIERFWNSIPQ